MSVSCLLFLSVDKVDHTQVQSKKIGIPHAVYTCSSFLTYFATKNRKPNETPFDNSITTLHYTSSQKYITAASQERRHNRFVVINVLRLEKSFSDAAQPLSSCNDHELSHDLSEMCLVYSKRNHHHHHRLLLFE